MSKYLGGDLHDIFYFRIKCTLRFKQLRKHLFDKNSLLAVYEPKTKCFAKSWYGDTDGWVLDRHSLDKYNQARVIEIYHDDNNPCCLYDFRNEIDLEQKDFLLNTEEGKEMYERMFEEKAFKYGDEHKGEFIIDTRDEVQKKEIERLVFEDDYCKPHFTILIVMNKDYPIYQKQVREAKIRELKLRIDEGMKISENFYEWGAELNNEDRKMIAEYAKERKKKNEQES